MVYGLTSFTATEPINSEKEGVVYVPTPFTATEPINSEKEGVVYVLTSFTASELINSEKEAVGLRPYLLHCRDVVSKQYKCET